MIAEPLPLVNAEDFRRGQLPLTSYFCLQLFYLETWLWNHRCWNKTLFFQSFLFIVLWMKQLATGMLCVYSLTENLAAFMQELVKDAIQVHLHILSFPTKMLIKCYWFPSFGGITLYQEQSLKATKTYVKSIRILVLVPGFKNIHSKNVTTHSPHTQEWDW